MAKRFATKNWKKKLAACGVVDMPATRTAMVEKGLRTFLEEHEELVEAPGPRR